MRYPPHLLRAFLKSVIVGALVGIVFAILCIALPAAGLIFAAGSLDLNWNLDWIPSAETIMAAGAIGGGIFAGGLFIKDRIVPYVEEVPDFENDAEDPKFLDRDD